MYEAAICDLEPISWISRKNGQSVVPWEETCRRRGSWRLPVRLIACCAPTWALDEAIAWNLKELVYGG